MSIYGGRAGLFTHGIHGESTIELPLPWREVPDYVLDMIGAYLYIAGEGKDASPRASRERARQACQARVEAVCAAAPDPALAGEFRHRLNYARRNSAFLDEHNHYIDQLAEGQHAQALIYAGRWLAGRGDLAHPYDVFWLQPPEVLSALRAQARHDFGNTITERKVQFETWRALQTPAYIGMPDPRLPERPATEDSPGDAAAAPPEQFLPPNTLVGQAASSGRSLGRAHIITERTSLPDTVPGDVLIAVNAGPLWTPIFPTLAGIVLDSGGPGDHTAITAREFNIPAVFGAANATSRIPQDAQVSVDGETGTVTWE
jgi:pyruvate,water dikinase